MTDIFILILLTLLNGFFSASEIALITIKKSRVKSLIENKVKGAEIIRQLQNDPNRLFATIQIGVTLVGTIASVFGGVKVVEQISQLLQNLPIPNSLLPFVDAISFAIVVLFITYLQIVLGELVPKSLALNHSERVALILAYPISFFNSLFYYLSQILISSSNFILKPFKDKTSFSETKLLAEEILHLLEEGVKKGTIETNEHEMIENIFEINETDAREVMVPRVDMVALPVNAKREELIKVLETMYSRIPVYKENLDNIVGILHIKDLLRAFWKKNLELSDEEIAISKIMRPPFFVPEGMKIGKILQEMQKRKIQIAIVVDEYGGTAGLLTLEDILEEIVGEIQDVSEGKESENQILKIDDNTFLVNGSCNIFDFNEFISEDVIPESEAYTTVAGFIIEQLGRFPEIDEAFEYKNLKFIIMKKEKHKIIQLRVEKHKKEVIPHKVKV
ncbi:MAG: hemolysin family protein [Leptospiraceae bacterium]|nr:hemolysin family protein [Leptospiraceae bacterium]MDW7975239.1 hemolysin family protein [Leptospiraceae bacterium]